jgi:hypothetical protein
MARRYDEFPGSETEDPGSSLRGALKGWFRHGACHDKLWADSAMPRDTSKGKTKEEIWWSDATQRVLGGYYRVDKTNIVDIQLAIVEVGAVYASAYVHDGWQPKLASAGCLEDTLIPYKKFTQEEKDSRVAAHAFALVGYNQHGFIVLNSWGEEWGHEGLAIITYSDWVDNSMDAWVAQLGVTTSIRETIAQTDSIATTGTGSRLEVVFASAPILQSHQMMPFIINVGNNGTLSSMGAYRTGPDDLKALIGHHLETARANFGLDAGEPVDVAIYAHGGLTSEEDAAKTFALWFPELYNAHIFPIFLMWETDPLSTIRYRLEDFYRQRAIPAGGLASALEDAADAVIENTVAPIGTAFWDEMKQNARQIAQNKSGGLRLLFDIADEKFKGKFDKFRIHLIGHSAGAIVHTNLAEYLGENNIPIASINFLAAAVRVDEFKKRVVPFLEKRAIGNLRLFHLSSELEREDRTCNKVLGYSRSLLYLVSRSFEGGREVPILGMEDFFEKEKDTFAKLKTPVKPFKSVSPQTASTSHGGFSSDRATRETVINLINKPA